MAHFIAIDTLIETHFRDTCVLLHPILVSTNFVLVQNKYDDRHNVEPIHWKKVSRLNYGSSFVFSDSFAGIETRFRTMHADKAGCIFTTIRSSLAGDESPHFLLLSELYGIIVCIKGRYLNRLSRKNDSNPYSRLVSSTPTMTLLVPAEHVNCVQNIQRTTQSGGISGSCKKAFSYYFKCCCLITYDDVFHSL